MLNNIVPEILKHKALGYTDFGPKWLGVAQKQCTLRLHEKPWKPRNDSVSLRFYKCTQMKNVPMKSAQTKDKM